MPKPKVYLRKKYKGGTSSANQLAKELGIKCVGKSTQLSDSSKPILINWGLSHPQSYPAQLINVPLFVGIAANKLLAYQKMAVSCPDLLIPWWTSLESINYTGRIVARTKLTGSCGEGIVTFKMSDDIKPEAKLYTKYIKNRIEFRVHVGFIGDEFDYSMQRKRRLTTEELEARGIYDRDLRIRNTNNGYIYSTNLDIDDELECKIAWAAQRAMDSLDLDFGAVDIIYDTKNKSILVLEVNTAPGINSELTHEFYFKYFTNLLSTIS